MGLTLGLDLGPNSIGWALVEDKTDGTGALVDCGVRVFPEGVDAFDTAKESSRNEQRRTARMMRRQIRRRARRKQVVLAALIEARLLPADDAERAAVLAQDPYPLRARAVGEKLAPFEIGRIIYHLNQRRGFLSLKKVSKAKVEKDLKALEKKNAKAAESGTTDGDGAIKKEEDSKMLAAIELLAQRIGTRTLGQTLHEQQTLNAARTVDGMRIPTCIRKQHTNRSMIEDEFLRIWDHQKQYHPDSLTDSACFGAAGRQDAQRTREGAPRDSSKTLFQQFGLHGLIFHQRPIYWPREMIGMCELEKGHRRCPRADRRAQRCRMLQEINNLRYSPTGSLRDERGLDDEQRATLLAALYTKEKLEFTAIRKLLDLLDSAKFNLERGERSSMKGCETDVRIARELNAWHEFEDAAKDGIVRVLIDAERDSAAAREALLTNWKMAEDAADVLLVVDLPKNYTRFSLKAIERLMPHLERGLILMGKSDAEASAMHAAGYLRRDQLQRRLFDQLPSLEMIRSGPLSDLPNPVVKATMHELRRVVNAIVREHGRPDAVHVEMARSLKMSGEKRRQYNKKIHERGEERDRVAALLRENKIAPTRDAVLKYRLWLEQKECCIYTNRSISFDQLYNGDTDIDHILPYSLTLDDSQMNKVVCFRDANREKGQRSPHDWLAGSDPERLKQIEQWGECLPFNKRRKLVQQEIKADDFLARQLVDTGYIARLAVAYLEMLVEKKHDVQGRKGTYTADLRHHWGIGDVIESLPDSPAWQEKANLSPGEKNRADHRHHALDAIVIALTNRKTLAAMHQGKETVNHVNRDTGELVEYQRFTKDIPPPWEMERESFRRMVLEKLRNVNVSHRVRRSVSGALHEETNYGPVWSPTGGTQRVEGLFVVRKPVDSLTMNEVENIRDEGIRKIVLKRLSDHGIKSGRKAEKVPPKKMQEAMKGLAMPSGVPIRKVRVLRSELTIRPLREGRLDEVWVKPGSTHHLCLFEWEATDKAGKSKKVRDAVFVPMLEARRRVKAGEEIIQRNHPDRPEARFVMSLSGGEMVLAKLKGQEGPVLLTYKTAASTSKQMQFAHSTDARRSGDQPPLSFKPATFDARKVTVNPLGRIRWAKD
ncbi:MAG: type II CRISPR RNA-guided endonuclease Cas9 [Tepidisphaeraceae bacterium]